MCANFETNGIGPPFSHRFLGHRCTAHGCRATLVGKNSNKAHWGEFLNAQSMLPLCRGLVLEHPPPCPDDDQRATIEASLMV